MIIDKFQSSDREEIINLLKTIPNLTNITDIEEKTVDQDCTHIHIAKDDNGKIIGGAVWMKPTEGDEAELMCIVTEQGNFCNTLLNPTGSFSTYYKLIVACIEDALAQGMTKGVFTIRNKTLIGTLKKTFNIKPIVRGVNLGEGDNEWEVHVDLEDALTQVKGVI